MLGLPHPAQLKGMLLEVLFHSCEHSMHIIFGYVVGYILNSGGVECDKFKEVDVFDVLLDSKSC